MGTLVLVTGGARSGKSTFAENRTKQLAAAAAAVRINQVGFQDTELTLEEKGSVMYVATSVPFDDEMRERVRQHQLRRPASWHTFEGYRQLSRVYETGEAFDVLMLDCITVMITNLIFDQIGDEFENLSNEDVDSLEQNILVEINELLEAVATHPQPAVLVTNEVGLGLVPENKLGRIFRDIAGRINQRVAAAADEVHLAVCGIPIRIK